VISYGVQYITDTGLRKYNDDIYGSWNKIVQGKINAEVIILGSSRAYVQYDPKVITNVTGLSCFNLSVNGGKILAQSAKYQSYLEHNIPPKILIQNIELMYLRKDDYIFQKEQFLPYLSDPEVSSYLELIDNNIRFEKLIPLYKYRGLNKTVLLGLKSYFHLTKKPTTFDYNGFRGQEKEWNNDFEKFKAASNEKERIYTKDDLAIGFEILNRLIKQCKDNNIRLILVHAPMYYELQQLLPQKDSLDNVIAKLAQKNGIEFWDYSKDRLSYSKKYFYNSMHLNMTEAEIFSRELAENLKAFIKEKESSTFSTQKFTTSKSNIFDIEYNK
jgi:hypothetical protein